MWMTVGLLSFLASVVLVVMGLIYLIKKKKRKSYSYQPWRALQFL